MDLFNSMDELRKSGWLTAGREVAIADYRKLKKPEEPLAIPTSSWKLAGERRDLSSRRRPLARVRERWGTSRRLGA